MGQLLLDYERREGMYFCFPDLGVVDMGHYHLTCTLIDMTPNVHSLASLPVAARCITEGFVIQSPKAFAGNGGMVDILSGPLSAESWNY